MSDTLHNLAAGALAVGFVVLLMLGGAAFELGGELLRSRQSALERQAFAPDADVGAYRTWGALFVIAAAACGVGLAVL